MKTFTFKTLSVVGLLFIVAAIILCGCSATEPLSPSGEHPSDAPFIKDVSPRVNMPGYAFVVFGENFDPTPSNNTITIGGMINLAVSYAENNKLIATLPTAATLASGEYSVSVNVNGKTASLDGKIKVVSVHVVGFDGLTAKYWKNGLETTDLSDGKTESSADAIFVMDKDVHIVTNKNAMGPDGVDEVNYAFYWKNGVETPLMGADFPNYAHSVVVTAGGDVYVGGDYSKYSSDIGNVPLTNITYWKNGMKQTDIDNGYNTYSTSLSMSSGGDVYVAGMKEGTTTYWINGTPTILQNPQNPFAANIAVNQIAVGDNNVAYVAGGSGYWIDGLYINNLLLSGTSFNSVALSPSNLYIGGSAQYTDDSGSVNLNGPAYWQLNLGVGPATLVLLSHFYDGKALSTAVSGSDVFTAGYEVEQGIKIAKFWINDRVYKVGGGIDASEARAIFIQ